MSQIMLGPGPLQDAFNILDARTAPVDISNQITFETGVEIISGGIFAIGNIIICQCRLTNKEYSPGERVILSGLPVPKGHVSGTNTLLLRSNYADTFMYMTDDSGDLVVSVNGVAHTAKWGIFGTYIAETAPVEITQTATPGQLQNDIALVYDPTADYTVGEFAMYLGNLYQCKTAITGGETWNSAHWDRVSIGQALISFRDGSITYESGLTDANNNTHIKVQGKLVMVSMFANTTVNKAADAKIATISPPPIDVLNVPAFAKDGFTALRVGTDGAVSIRLAVATGKYITTTFSYVTN